MAGITGKPKRTLAFAARGYPLPEGGYRDEEAFVAVHSAGAAVYLDIESPGEERVELALKADQTLALIAALQSHLKNHAVRKIEWRHSLDEFAREWDA